MYLTRIFAAAAAVSLTACPIVVLAQAAAAPAPAAAPSATPTPPTAPPPAAEATAPSPNLVANGNMVSTLQGSGHFTILLKALEAANLKSVLSTTPDITLFAPTDDAFHALPPIQLAALLLPKNAPVLQQVLTYHLVHLNLDSSKFKGAKGPVESVERGKLEIDGSGAVLKVNNANIIQADVRATNGVIQVVDKVLIPSDVALPAASASLDSPAAAGR